MTTVLEVQPAAEFRASVPSLLRRFRAEHAAATPVVFGANRRPEAVVIPFELYAELLPILEDLEIARLVRDRESAGEAVPLADVAAEFGIDIDALEG
jgi:antitoxin StbD